ncbi:DUF3397 domain-containing protein [Evansella sp. AB-rgal1]|uniref:DUF3397 domain-containing protein n=1 Tax=Evansella sp. AB-rgal1 TaxID=3242696 RepID=UPI00359DB5A6
MNGVSEVFVFVAATLVTAPLIGLYIVYLIAVKSTHNKVYSVKLAVDSTAFLFIIAVYFIILEIWEVRIMWLFILFVLLSAMIFTFLHWKKYEDIQITKVLKGVWRFQFFVFFVLYFILIFYGLVRHVYVLAK